ncbi:protein of unknown function [Kosakonia oryzendophytica]|uniref:Uncharacterized protein n=2 Tax=Enterobacteriaceae TaxID=543 RepID=A0A1C3YR29_9ENTR|nr:YdiL protein [Enterobacter sp. FY-07]TDT59049.1 uncharacterized protein DUF1870 [Enterobacter sp. AG5470]SCB72478.1 protein of unknown function [Kosakonia oryzendophytica]
MMNAYELQALRHIFAMTVEECAIWIAPDNTTAEWQAWENGEKAIPADIVAKLLELRKKRQTHINALISRINNRIGNNTMRFFADLAAFQTVYRDGDYLDWKVYQSVAAELYAHDLEHLC